MSTANATRIFGIRVAFDPKLLVGVLIVAAGLLFWYNSSSSDDASTPVARPDAATISSVPASGTRPTVAQRRAGAPANDRSTLRMRPIDASRGDVDPTLRLDLLRRLGTVQPSPATRSLFEIGSVIAGAVPTSKINAPKVPIYPPLAATLPGKGNPPLSSLQLQANIPYKYYGFVKPSTPRATNRGLFLDEKDDVIVAAEGEVVKQRYLVVELTPNSARLEDTQLKQSRTLPVVPVAQP